MKSKKIKKEKKRFNILSILPNLIGAIITIIIGISLMGTISSQLDNAMNCNSTSMYVNITGPEPKGSTGSFGGGGGDYHFGGYDGKVVHKSFLSQYSVIKTNQSVMGCLELSSASQSMLSLVPMFFAIAILGAAIATVAGALRQSGMV